MWFYYSLSSPLRVADDIDATIVRCHEDDTPVAETVAETDKPPEWMYTLTSDNCLRPVFDSEENVTRRQDAEATYVLNGAVYVAEKRVVKERADVLDDGNSRSRYA
ncbi:hypothetical protein [Salinibacter ruber]|uniref:hypothetical protein n=1 Tax=Salinibacter ruber TaxID=146919 RepID=UPI00216880AE|nr:hypothetical protein [Salinibacter ruber]